MKTIILSLTLAVIALLCGCANLGTMLIPEQDPHLVNAEATAKSSEVVVKSFKQYELANRNADLDAKQTARSLETFDEELNDLKTLQKMYAKYRSGENLTRLISQTQQVQAARDRAATAMVGGPVERGAPFAPGIAPPGAPPTTLDTILGRLDGIRAEQQSIRAEQVATRQEQAATRAAIGQLGKAVWELTNTNSAATNAPPVPGK